MPNIVKRAGKWIAAAVILAIAGTAHAAEQCAGLGPPLRPGSAANAASQFFDSLAAGLSPDAYEAQRRQQAARATYDALLAAGAPELLACAAALNPEVLRQIAPTYFGRPSR